MRNYVVLNGVKSTTIKGLLIQELPPIAKPLMRTQIETIDGRDGDIVTNLGYSAYEKEMTIGLFGDYDIDDVIQYFDSQGTVTFSNEPDKYYNYQIIKEINFDRLIRFRTATVTFYVQPFKYSDVEGQLDFTDLANLFDASSPNTLNAYFNASVTTITAHANNKMLYVPCEPNTTYTISQISTPIFNVGYTNELPQIGTPVYGVVNKGQTIDGRDIATLTTGASAEYLVLRYYNSSTSGVSEQDVLNSIKIQEGNSMVLDSVSVINSGNTASKPTLTIYGSGTINLYLNNNQIFVISLGDSGYITIDAAQMNAYQDNVFMNRLVTGDYDDLSLEVGTNEISWTGNVSELLIENYSRWI